MLTEAAIGRNVVLVPELVRPLPLGRKAVDASQRLGRLRVAHVVRPLTVAFTVDVTVRHAEPLNGCFKTIHHSVDSAGIHL